MIAALTLFVVLTLFVLVIHTGAVALRLTGLPEEVRSADEIFFYGPDQVLAQFGAAQEQLERN